MSNRKRPTFCSTLALNWVFGTLLKLLLFSSEGASSSDCSATHRNAILSSVVKCSTSPVMLDLRHLILASNSSLGVPVEEVVQVVPDTVAVSRC